MTWYSFRQNNSGGVFDYDANSGISVNVFIEADTPEQANVRAESIGIYFDDDFDVDCSCCGQRWSRVYFEEGVRPPTENEPFTVSHLRKWMDEGEPESFVHPKDRPFYGAHKTVVDTIEYGGVNGYGVMVTSTGEVTEVFPVTQYGWDESGDLHAPVHGVSMLGSDETVKETPFGFVEHSPTAFTYWFRDESDAVLFQGLTSEELGRLDIPNLVPKTVETVYTRMN